MILVDSSVWIDYFRSADTPQVALLDSYFGRTRVAVGDLIAAEVLQGVRDEKDFKWVKNLTERLAARARVAQAPQNLNASRSPPQCRPSTVIGAAASFITMKLPPPMSRR